MDQFTVTIAGQCIGITAAFGSTREYFRAYLSEDTPAVLLEATEAEAKEEQQLLNEEADREGLRRRVFTPPFLERAVLQRRLSHILAARDTLLLHGSTVAVDGRSYLFTAKCGVGKSTHTKLWRELLGERAVMVNDDRAFLHIGPQSVTAYGSPWSGKHGLHSNLCAPLAGICILERGLENRIAPLAAEEALGRVWEQVFLPTAADGPRLLALTEALLSAVPLWKMTCTKEPAAARMAYAAMSGSLAAEATPADSLPTW